MTQRPKLWIGNAGWVRCAFDDREHRVYLRFTPDERGRLAARELVIDSDGGSLTAQTARIPIGEIEARVNGDSRIYDDILRTWQNSSPVGGPADGSAVAVLVSHFGGVHAGKHKHRPSSPSASTSTAYRLSEVPNAGLTDEFLGRLRRAYFAAIQRGEAPNKAIATDLHLSRRTVERWVYIARQRGIMPPARTGAKG